MGGKHLQTEWGPGSQTPAAGRCILGMQRVDASWVCKHFIFLQHKAFPVSSVLELQVLSWGPVEVGPGCSSGWGRAWCSFSGKTLLCLLLCPLRTANLSSKPQPHVPRESQTNSSLLLLLVASPFLILDTCPTWEHAESRCPGADGLCSVCRSSAPGQGVCVARVVCMCVCAMKEGRGRCGLGGRESALRA